MSSVLLTATGTTQGSAFQIGPSGGAFGTVPSGSGTILPEADQYTVPIFNLGANALSVYPAVGDRIGSSAINAAASIAAGAAGTFVTLDTPLMAPPRTWYFSAAAVPGGGGVRVISGTTGTLLASDNGNGVQCTNGSAVALTVPTGLGAFSCYVIQAGAGQVTPTASGTTINNRSSFTKTAGQYAVISLISTAANVFVMGGDGA